MINLYNSQITSSKNMQIEFLVPMYVVVPIAITQSILENVNILAPTT